MVELYCKVTIGYNPNPAAVEAEQEVRGRARLVLRGDVHPPVARRPREDLAVREQRRVHLDDGPLRRPGLALGRLGGGLVRLVLGLLELRVVDVDTT